MQKFTKIVLSLTLSIGSCAASGNLLIDGNFDNLGAGARATTYTLNTFETVSTRLSGTAQGWYLVGMTSSTSSKDLDCIVISTNIQNCNNITFGTTPTLSPDGGNFLSVDSDSTYNLPIAQNVSITAGLEYQLTFYQAAAQQSGLGKSALPGGGTTEPWSVTLNGGTAQTSTLMNNAYEGFTGWTQQTMSFIDNSTNASAVLQFIALGTPAGFPPITLLDGVNFSQVPEPSTWGLTGLGLLAIVFVRKLR